jgi:N-acetylneuraminic acid mutarotase
MSMSKGLALVLVLVFLTASCIIVAKPVSGTSAVGNIWVEKAPMPTARGGLGVAVVNGKIYAIGGSTAQVSWSTGLPVTGGVVGTNEEYDTATNATNTWTTKAPMPTPRAYFATAVYQNKIYCIGGSTAVSANPDEALTTVNEVYDPATDTWTTKSPMPVARSGQQDDNVNFGLYNLQANVVDGKIYLLGGVPDWTLNEVYDPANDSWTTKAPMPSQNYWSTSTVFDDKIYAFGTRTEIYNPETDNWTSGASSPYTVSGVAVATTGIMAPKRIYVFSGYDIMSGWSTSEDLTNTNQIYNAQNNTWTLGIDLPTNRIDFNVAVINDMFYVIGGIIRVYPIPFGDVLYDDTPSAVNEQYTPVGYGTPDQSYVLETTPPKISVLSPLNQTYTEPSVSLIFAVDKAVNWSSYSLDGRLNQTVTGNTTLAGLSSGLHSITVYSNDTFGNIGASQTITFTVALPIPTLTVAAVAGAVALVVVVAGLLVYFKKRSRQK